MANAHKEVLKALIDSNINMTEVAERIAIENPSVFLKNLHEPAPEYQESVGEVLIRHLKASEKIQAIKELRAATGLGLKHTKHMIDALEKCLRDEGQIW